MPIRIRLSRGGRKKKPFYRVVAANSEAPRDGKFLDILGTYDPLKEPFEFKVDSEKLNKWLEIGAEPTQTVKNLLIRCGYLKKSSQNN